MKKCVLLCLIVVLFSCNNTQSVDSGHDWPRWQGPNGDGISTETDWNPRALAGGAKVLWSRDVGMGYSGIVIQGNRLYTMGQYEGSLVVFCLDAETGKTIWQRSFPSTFFPQSTLALDEDCAYGLDKQGLLFCLRTRNGKVLWQKDMRKDFGVPLPFFGWATSPVIEGDLLLLNANTAAMALDKRTGNLTWTIADTMPPTSEGSYATAVLGDYRGTRCAFFLGPSTLNVVDVKTGETLWSYSHPGDVELAADPVVQGNEVFIQACYSCTHLELDTAAPRVLWSNAELNTVLYAAVLVEGYLFGTQTVESHVNDSSWSAYAQDYWTLRCIEWRTGSVMWDKKMKHTSLVAAGDKLIILELDGTLHIAEATPASYSELSSADVLRGANTSRIFATPPVLSRGKIYCRNFSGDLVCIDVRK